MMIFTQTFPLCTKGFCDIIDITPEVRSVVRESGITDGLVTVFCAGSTGAVTTIEYETGVVQDLKKALERLAPADISYAHDRRWGDGNGYAHVRAALMKPSLCVPLASAKLTLGTWQQIVFMDFDNRERQRDIVVQIIGE
jgi:secondary thiamine-phosphate synthase enzyme